MSADKKSAPARTPMTKEALTDIIAAGLRDTYHCTRVWSAWSYGTMRPGDFSPVDESDTPAELADAVLAALAAPTPAPAPQPGWCQGCSPDNCGGCGAATSPAPQPAGEPVALPDPDMMVDMVPQPTSRDRWMYQQGRLAEMRRASLAPSATARVPLTPPPAPFVHVRDVAGSNAAYMEGISEDDGLYTWEQVLRHLLAGQKGGAI
jgi:hypothetical protein